MYQRTFLGASVNVRFALLLVLLGAGCAAAVPAATAVDRGLPEAAMRTYAVNYKDMMLAGCIAAAYKDAPLVVKDAGYSASGFNEWTRYDVESATGVEDQVIERYLARTYHAKEAPDVRLDLMKCLDMYHSAELDAQMRKYVDRPSATYAGDERNGE
jgi:hypothetical protein